MEQLLTNAGASFKVIGAMICSLMGLLFGIPGRILETVGEFFFGLSRELETPRVKVRNDFDMDIDV